jgi:hypothetical protein
MRLEQTILRRRTSAAEDHGVASFARQLFAKLAKRRVRADIIGRIKTHHRIKKWSLWSVAGGRRNNIERILAHHAQLKPAGIAAAIVSFDQWGSICIASSGKYPSIEILTWKAPPAIPYARGPFGCCSNHDGAVLSTMSDFPYCGSS